MSAWKLDDYDEDDDDDVKRNDLCAQVPFNMCKEMGVKLEKEHWRGYVETSHVSKVTVLWKQRGETERV